jgi:hypothetical protein
MYEEYGVLEGRNYEVREPDYNAEIHFYKTIIVEERIK